MKLYLAGADKWEKGAEFCTEGNVLVSYHSTGKKGENYWILDPEKRIQVENVFLDCGAYSAWTQGISIDVHEYSRFCLRYGAYFSVYAHLDDKNSQEKTMENLKIMEEEYGLKPLPVFHVSSKNWDLLEKMLSKYDYIALGAIAGESTAGNEQAAMISKCFSLALQYGVDSEGRIIKKYHGFGFTQLAGLKKFPWYSVDSTTWMGGVKYGTVPVFDKKASTIKYIGIADRKGFSRHFRNLPEDLKNIVKFDRNVTAQNYTSVYRLGAYSFRQVQDYITKYWEKRGVKH